MIGKSSLYGESLLSFSEQFQPFDYFDMIPEIDDNYIVVPTSGFNGTNPNTNVTINGISPTGRYLGIFQNALSEVKNSNGNIVTYNHFYLWCEEQFKLGAFIYAFNETFRIIPGNDWSNYGGFFQYDIEKLVGSRGNPQIDSGMSNGSGSFR
jgi:hypothetical protein